MRGIPRWRISSASKGGPGHIGYLILAFLILAGISAGSGPVRRHLIVQMAQIHRLGSFAPAAFAAICTVLSAAGVPGAALSAAGGLVFGPWQGMGLSVLGTTAGSIFLFLGGRKTRFSGIPDPGFWAIFLARLSPVVPFAPIAYAAGLTRMSLGRFAAASAAGAPLCAWLYAMIGSSAMAWPVTFAGWVIHLTGLAATIGGLWLLSKAFRREES